MSGTATKQEVNIRANSLRAGQARMGRKVPLTVTGMDKSSLL